MDQRMAGQLQPETVFQGTAPAFTHSCPSTTAAPVWRAMGTTKPTITNWPRAQTGRLDSQAKHGAGQHCKSGIGYVRNRKWNSKVNKAKKKRKKQTRRLQCQRSRQKVLTGQLMNTDMNSQLFGKDPDAGKDWRQEEKGTTEDEMTGWHHRLNGHEFEQTLGDGEWKACCSPWGHKESDTNEQLNNSEYWPLSLTAQRQLITH